MIAKVSSHSRVVELCESLSKTSVQLIVLIWKDDEKAFNRTVRLRDRPLFNFSLTIRILSCGRINQQSINNQQSTINNHQSSINNQQSTINNQSAINQKINQGRISFKTNTCEIEKAQFEAALKHQNIRRTSSYRINPSINQSINQSINPSYREPTFPPTPSKTKQQHIIHSFNIILSNVLHRFVCLRLTWSEGVRVLLIRARKTRKREEHIHG